MKKKILVADDERQFVDLMKILLESKGYQVLAAYDGHECIEVAKTEKPDMILLDILMPEMTGLEVKEVLDEDISTATIPVVFLTAKGSVKEKVEGLKKGIDDYITKPFEADELIARIQAIMQRRKFYEKISMTDGLTGVFNVQYYKKQIKTFFAVAKRYKQVFSLAIIDIDKLKYINDKYGHPAGDFALRIVADALKTTLREADIITRYGGDEFAVILPNSSEKQTLIALDRIKLKINGKKFLFGEKKLPIPISISTGCAEYGDGITSEDKLFELADTSMYEDKKKKKI